MPQCEEYAWMVSVNTDNASKSVWTLTVLGRITLHHCTHAPLVLFIKLRVARCDAAIDPAMDPAMVARRDPGRRATPGMCMFNLNDKCNKPKCQGSHIVCQSCWEAMGPIDIENYKDIMASWAEHRFCTTFGCYQYLRYYEQEYCTACVADESRSTPNIPPAASSTQASSPSVQPEAASTHGSSSRPTGSIINTGVNSSTPDIPPTTSSTHESSRSSPRHFRDFKMGALLDMQKDIMKEIEIRLGQLRHLENLEYWCLYKKWALNHHQQRCQAEVSIAELG